MRVISNAFWLSFSRVGADVLSFALFAMIARSFGPAGSGAYSYAFALSNLAALIATSGFEEYGIRQYVSCSCADRPRLWSDMMSAQSLRLMLTAGLLAVFVLADRQLPAARPVIIELAVFLTGWGLARTLFVPAMAAQSMLMPALTDFGCRLSAIALAVGMLALAHPSLVQALIAFPFAGVAMAGLALRNCRKHGAPAKLHASWNGIVSTLRGIAPFAGSDILNQFYARTDLLLIAFLLGDAAVGLYAADVKFVEVGLVPLILIGTAVYPLLIRLATDDPARFELIAGELVRTIMILSAWLAVGICCLIPPLVGPVFGVGFREAIPLLPWFAVFALVKGAETVLWRLLYSTHRQVRYVAALAFGTALIALLNFTLIPKLGVRGAIIAGILSTVAVDLICLHGLRQHVRMRVFISAGSRVAVALAVTAVIYKGAAIVGLTPWPRALLAVASLPIAGAFLGLVPDIRHSQLFGRYA